MTARERIDEYERLSRLKSSGSTARVAPATSQQIDQLRVAMVHLAARRRAMSNDSRFGSLRLRGAEGA